MVEIDQKFFIWINSFAGKSSVIDNLASILCSDHFFPVLLSLLLLGLWFGEDTLKNRLRSQKCVFMAFLGLAIANLNVALINFIFFRYKRKMVSMFRNESFICCNNMLFIF